MIKILEKIIYIIYPQTCSICGYLNTKSLCNKCKLKLKKEFEFQEDDYSNNTNINFKKHYYFFKYQELIRNQIISLKFQEKPYVFKTISTFLENNQKDFEKLKKYDIILIVPVSKQRKKERGYNQSELIGKEIAKMLNIKILSNVLIKIKNTPAQSTLNKSEREKNIKNVYKVHKIEKIKNKKILIFDDIYTTGNTVNECSKQLITEGISKENISILTIAKD